MFVAYRDHGSIRVPGERSEFVALDHRWITLRGFPAYRDTDGALVAGYTNSPIRTDIVYTHFPEDGADYEANRRVRPVVCHRCHDSGEDGTGPDYWCRGCDGHGHRKNLHLCSECGEFAREELPVHPRATVNHELLLPRTHPACAIESLRAELRGGVVRASEAA